MMPGTWRVFTMTDAFAKRYLPKATLFTLLLLAASMLAAPAGAMINPSAAYCTALGYQYTDTVASDGAMTGYCVLPGNQNVDAWKFLQGSVSPDMSYCRQQGLEVRTVSDPAVCGMLGSTCAVCVKADGSTREVTNMMGLDFREKICNANTCCDPAKDATCSIAATPAPCQPGVDPDCGTPQPTAKSPTSFFPVLVGIGAGMYLLKKKYE